MLQAGVLERSKRLPDAAISFAQTEAPIKAVVLGCASYFAKIRVN